MMKRWNFNVTFIVVALAMVGLPTLAAAEVEAEVDEAPADMAPPMAEEEGGLSLQLAAGFRGGLLGFGGEGFSNPSNVTATDGRQYSGVYPEYFGHFGVGGAGGLSLEVRAMNFIGLEFGYHYGGGTAHGYVDKNDASTGRTITRLTSEQTTTAYHIPLLLKVNIPADFVRPFFGIGIELIRQVSAEIEYGEEVGTASQSSYVASLNERNEVRAVDYNLLLASAGVELVFGSLRVPIELRVGYNLGYSSDINDRARVEIGDSEVERVTVDSMYMGHISIFSGLLYEFDLL